MKYGNGQPVQVTVVDQSDAVTISVSDKGIGIAPESLDRIFDRFERAVGANEISGLGLGLFITKETVLAHQGKICAESKLGEGSTFKVQLTKSKI